MLSSDEEEPWCGNPEIVECVFASPPVEIYDEQIIALEAQVKKLEERRNALNDEIRAASVSEQERKNRLMQYRALRRIDEFISGRFTHLVMHRYAKWEIMTLDQAIKYKESDYDRVPSALRLLSLFGKTNGDLEWHLNQYSDGSGSRDIVYPCCSQEEAIEILEQELDKAWAEWRVNPKQQYHAIGAAESAKQAGLPIPADVSEMIRSNKIASSTKARDDAKLKYEQAEKELAAIQ